MKLLKKTIGVNLLLLSILSVGVNTKSKADETVNYFISDTLYVDVNGDIIYDEDSYLSEFQSENSGLIAIESVSTANISCNSTGSQVIDFVLTDGSLLLDGSLTLTILDTIAPVLIPNSSLIYNLGEDGNVEMSWASINLNSNDNCSFTYEITPSSFSCSDVGNQEVSIVLTDPSGNVSSDTVSVTIIDNMSPVIQMNQVVAYLDSMGNAQISVHEFNNGTFDNCNEDFSFTLSDSLFTLDDLGMNNVNLSVTNSNGEFSSINAQVEVKDTMAPFIHSQNLTMYLDASGNLDIVASAFDNGTVDNSLIYNLSTNVNHFDCDDLGMNTIVLTATDNYNNFSSENVNLEILDNIAPQAIAHNITLVLDAAGNAILNPEDLDNGSSDNCHVNFSASETSFDCDDLGTHNVFLTVTDNNQNSNSAAAEVTIVDNISPSAQAQNLTLYLNEDGIVSLDPEDLDNGSSDNCSSNIEFSASQTLFDCSDLGGNTVVFSIEDEQDNTSSINVSVEVEDNIPPVVILQNIVASLDTNGEFHITQASIDIGSYDNCSDQLIFSFSDTLLTNTDLGDNNITVIVSDSNGNSADGEDIVITINDNLPPVLMTPIADRVEYSETNLCGKFVFFDLPIFIDNSGDYAVSYSHGSGSFFGLGTTNVVYSAIDASNNITTDTFSIIVLDNTPPEVVSTVSNYTFNEIGVVTWDESQLVFSDNCSSTLPYTLSHHSLDTFSIGNTTVTGSVIDESNNITPFSFVISVEDIIDPEFDFVPEDFEVYLTANAGCEQAINYSPAQASDNYSNVQITYSIESGTLLGVGIHEIVITATDSTGNSIEEIIEVEVKDTISPVFTSVPTDINVGHCDNLIAYHVPEVSDNCGILSLVRVSGLPSGSNFPTGGHSIVYRATDLSGNVSEVTFEVNVFDVDPPFVSGVQVGCTENEAFELGEDIDNIVFSGPGIENNVFDPAISGSGIHSVSWIWTDTYGCEHLGNMEMIINQTPPMPIIVQTNVLQLSVHNAYNSYQWYRNGEILDGETNVSMNFTMGGNYEVLAGNESDCYILSGIYTIGNGPYPSLDIEELEKEGVFLSPNPAENLVTITSYMNLEGVKLEMINSLGQVFELLNSENLNSNQLSIDVSDYPQGVYTLNLFFEKGLLSKKLIIK